MAMILLVCGLQYDCLCMAPGRNPDWTRADYLEGLVYITSLKTATCPLKVSTASQEKRQHPCFQNVYDLTFPPKPDANVLVILEDSKHLQRCVWSM